ncbi:hypothetical protein ABZX72_15070 [Streptomyces cyaneofuscatus]|uniref:hypothetical protein n=1 Tax=Streptomyces cyaneofuscatus TaxID=66883 RepID=UPI0033AFB9B6
MTTATPTGRPLTPAPLHRHRARALIASGVALLLGALTQGCASGRVMAESEFREHMRLTEEAGEEAVRRLGMDPSSIVDGHEMANASCKDEFGSDGDGVTRDQPRVTWAPRFESGAAYRAAVATLRAAWSEQGLTVEDIPAPGKGERGAGLPGVRAEGEHDVDLSLRPDRYSGEPTLTADGGCVRHRGYLISWE